MVTQRRSARIASAQRGTESPAPQLGAVVEHEEPAEIEQKPKQKREKKSKKQKRDQREEPVAAPSSPKPQPSTPSVETPVKLPMSEMHPSKVHPTTAPPPATPSAATPVKLPMSEMHPSKVHSTMAPPSSGLKLGFVDINPDEKSKDHPSGVTQSTPSKTPLPSSAFSFRFNSDLQLGPEARQMMEQLHSNEEVARIKAKLAAEQKDQLEAELQSRRIAQAKGKASRYSAAHIAEFKKMDSIENHPSLYRGNPDRHTPMKTGLKRSQSKADLQEPEPTRSSKSTSAHSSSKSLEKKDEEQETRTKRLRQRLEDDASTSHPITRDASSIPRPRTIGSASAPRGLPRSQTQGSLMTPTKASLARSNSTRTPAVTVAASPKPSEGVELNAGAADSPSGHARQRRVDFAGLMRSSSKKAINGLVKSQTTSNLLDARSTPARVQTPGRFDRVKSILKKPMSGFKTTNNAATKASTNDATKLPLAKTPKIQFADKALPPIPLTTPGRKLVKPVDFTPRAKHIAMVQNSPSPIKSGIPRSATFSKIPTSLPKPSSTTAGAQKAEREVSYPDLSEYTKDIDREPEESEDTQQEATPSAPGAFTFRSDHTIQFDDHPIKGFGGSAGQSSVRHVRDSGLFGTHMPGSFPRLAEAPTGGENKETKENKENTDPKSVSKVTSKEGISAVTLAATPTRRQAVKTAPTSNLSGIPHGMSNKKRSRATSDDEEDTEPNAKKQRKNPAEGNALVAPRLASKQSPVKKSTQLSHTPSPRKRAGGISMSRLNALARPKARN